MYCHQNSVAVTPESNHPKNVSFMHCYQKVSSFELLVHNRNDGRLDSRHAVQDLLCDLGWDAGDRARKLHDGTRPGLFCENDELDRLFAGGDVEDVEHSFGVESSGHGRTSE